VITALASVAIRLHALLVKEFLQLLRDPRMRFFLIAPPVLQVLLFGYAATFDVRHADVAVIDRDGGPQARELRAAITSSGHYTLHAFTSMREAAAAMDRGEVRVILQIPESLARAGVVQLLADGSDPNSAQLIVGQLSRIVREQAQRMAGVAPPVTVEERAWFNPNLEDRWYFIPGVIANIVFTSTMMLTAMAVVREREHGTLERLLVTPVARLEFLVGKMIPVASLGLVEVLLITGVAVGWFEVPFRGDLSALVAASLILLASTQGLGLIASSYSSTQQQAMLTAIFFIMPMVILSGFAFPIRNMPAGVQLLTWFDPLRYYLVIVRDLFLKGGGIASHPFEYAMMGLLGVATILFSALKLR